MSCSCYPSLTLAPQVRRSELEADLRPVTPSKIPVGAFRVEEEKAINRALTGGAQDSNRQKSPPPVTVSRYKMITETNVTVACCSGYLSSPQSWESTIGESRSQILLL